MTTPNGKEIELFNEGFAIKARFVGGGQLPDELAGSWTTKTFAMDHIRQYLTRMEAKPKKHKVELNKEDYKR